VGNYDALRGYIIHHHSPKIMNIGSYVFRYR